MGKSISSSVLGIARRVILFAELVRFQHTIFALPFAVISALIAAGHRMPDSGTIIWLLIAMVAARSSAMGFNRMADARYDRLNPRTAGRAIPRGRMTVAAAAAFTAAAAVAFVIASAMLNALCLALSPVALTVILGYSYTKRFTSWSHLVLGFALALAPIGAWLGVTGGFNGLFWLSALLGAAVALWTAGFDVIYGCLDVDFDRSAGLHSLPVRFGVGRALTVSRIMHAIAFLLLAAFVAAARLGIISYVGVACVGILLIYEQSIVRPKDLSRVNVAFFTVNGLIGLLFMTAVLIDVAS